MVEDTRSDVEGTLGRRKEVGLGSKNKPRSDIRKSFDIRGGGIQMLGEEVLEKAKFYTSSNESCELGANQIRSTRYVMVLAAETDNISFQKHDVSFTL